MVKFNHLGFIRLLLFELSGLVAYLWLVLTTAKQPLPEHTHIPNHAEIHSLRLPVSWTLITACLLCCSLFSLGNTTKSFSPTKVWPRFPIALTSALNKTRAPQPGSVQPEGPSLRRFTDACRYQLCSNRYSDI